MFFKSVAKILISQHITLNWTGHLLNLATLEGTLRIKLKHLGQQLLCLCSMTLPFII